MISHHWMIALLGGVLIGISATLLLAFNGRIAGISGMVNGALSLGKSEVWRGGFLIGMMLGGGLYEYGLHHSQLPSPRSPPGP